VLALALPATLGSAGCGAGTYYDWGRYEDSVYAVTARPDGFDLQAEIDSLEQQIEETISKERPIPPGLHAHLAYLHSVAGNPVAAREHLERERALYPEAARFVDYMEAGLRPGT
jgi:hypothetical protein